METESTTPRPDPESPVIMDILRRLPMRTLMQCRSVCRAWHAFLAENYFYVIYARRTPTTLMLPVQGSSIHDLRFVYAIETDNDSSSVTCGNLWISNAAASPCDVPDFEYQLGNSCNGLICLLQYGSQEPTAIWNPIMGQYSILPRSSSISDQKVVCGLGYCSRKNRYKVLRVFHERQAPHVRWATEIFDFRPGGKWRRIVDAPRPLPSLVPGFYVCNTLHWVMDYDGFTGSPNEPLIRCFSFTDEEFHSLPPPPLFSPQEGRRHYWSNLGILQGCLSICSNDAVAFRPDIVVWVMEEYGVPGSWVMKLSIKDPGVDWWDPYRWIQMISFLRNGEIVVLCGDRWNCMILRKGGSWLGTTWTSLWLLISHALFHSRMH